MPYFVYIIFSEKLNKYYIGHTEALEIRLNQHNSGMSDFTSKAQDWVLMYSEVFDERDQAYKREREIKKKKSRKYIEWLIGNK